MAYAKGWMEDLPPLPPPPWRRTAMEEPATRPEPAESPRPRRDEVRWFGFDAPRRDYQAERAVRRARLEAMDRQAREEREARRRDWARGREEARRRQDWREERRQDRPWRETPPDDGRAGDLPDRESFTGPQ